MESNKFTESLRKGTILHGNYRIEDYLASGGFGNTYVVTHTELEETFAIKEFYMKGVSERCHDSTTVRVSNVQNRDQFESQLRKFKKEALRLRKLHDPHIVRVHDLFEENGTAYYVMDYIDGMSLSAYVKKEGKPLKEEQVWSILPQILLALNTVHATGYQHLDLKPANIMMDREGNITLIDFGACKQLDVTSGNSTSSALAYTPGFAPREQMEQNLSKLGPWTDLYALGATLYNLITAKEPPLPSDIDDEHERAFCFPEHISDKLKNLILWMMMSKRDKRPQSVQQVREQLEKGQAVLVDYGVDEVTKYGQEDNNKKPTRQSSPNPNKKLKRYALFCAIAAVVILMGVALKLWYHDDVMEQEKPEPEMLQVYDAEYTNPDMGTYSYTGPVDSEQQPHGKGKAKLANNDSYEGDFLHGVFEGEAIYIYAEGDKFKGKFSNNQFSEGTYTTVDGICFIGTFKNGQPAEGTWYDADGNKL